MNAVDFNATLKELAVNPKPMHHEFGEKLRADEYNEIFDAIESKLNSLYIRMRFLEDVKNYCREYLLREIQEKTLLFQNKLTLIEQTASAFRERDSIAYPVIFAPNTNDVTDRNNDSIPQMNFHLGEITNFSNVSNIATISNVICDSDELPYNSTCENLKSGNPCRSIYKFNEPKFDGIRESYKVMFVAPIHGNYVKINTVNCVAANVSLILDSGE